MSCVQEEYMTICHLDRGTPNTLNIIAVQLMLFGEHLFWCSHGRLMDCFDQGYLMQIYPARKVEPLCVWVPVYFVVASKTLTSCLRSKYVRHVQHNEVIQGPHWYEVVMAEC